MSGMERDQGQVVSPWTPRGHRKKYCFTPPLLGKKGLPRGKKNKGGVWTSMVFKYNLSQTLLSPLTSAQ